MHESRFGLLTIGGFANASQLSLKALRLYDQLGLLRPSFVDPESSYRYYHTDQLHTARLIRMLRQMEMPLATIRRVLAATPTHAEGLVDDHVRWLASQAAQARRIMRDVLVHIYQEELPMTLEVQVRDVPAQPIVSITKRVYVADLESTINTTVDELFALVQRQHGTAAGAPFGIYHGKINDDEDGPIEICLPTTTLLAAAGEANVTTLPPMKVASTMLTAEQCTFPAVLQGYDVTYDWVQQHGYHHGSDPHEIWHSKPGEPERMEIAWPFAEREESVASG